MRSDQRVETPWVLGRTAQQSPLRLVNASSTGLCFETPERLPVRGSVRVRLDLPSGRSDLSGKIVWCRFVGTQWDETTWQEEMGAVYKAGLRLDGGAVWRQELLSQIVAH